MYSIGVQHLTYRGLQKPEVVQVYVDHTPVTQNTVHFLCIKSQKSIFMMRQSKKMICFMSCHRLSKTAKDKIAAVKIKIIYGTKSYVRTFIKISHTQTVGQVVATGNSLTPYSHSSAGALWAGSVQCPCHVAGR